MIQINPALSPPHHPSPTRELSAAEANLVYSLRALYDFRGAEAFVRRYGVEVIEAAVRDMRGQAEIRDLAGFLR